MGKEDDQNGDEVATTAKVWFPWWRAAPTMVKIVMTLVLGGVAIAYINPWKHQQPTSQETTAITHTVGGDEIRGDKAGRDIIKPTYYHTPNEG
jgi:hypothetical protein